MSSPHNSGGKVRPCPLWPRPRIPGVLYAAIARTGAAIVSSSLLAVVKARKSDKRLFRKVGGILIRHRRRRVVATYR